jgi:hypothetical protein
MIDTFASALLLCAGFGLIMQRSAIARQPVWESWARQLGQSAPDVRLRSGLVLISGLALLCSGLLRFFE